MPISGRKSLMKALARDTRHKPPTEIELLQARFGGMVTPFYPERKLMVDGVWQVPPGERPKGWREMGGREHE